MIMVKQRNDAYCKDGDGEADLVKQIVSSSLAIVVYYHFQLFHVFYVMFRWYFAR